MRKLKAYRPRELVMQGRHNEPIYIKSEADAAIAELKEVVEDACLERDDNSRVIDELEAENRKLKRALWISRAKAYRYIAELIACFNPDYVRNRKMFTPNNLKQKQMNSLKWARLMLKIERKCRDKAEEYK